MEDLRSWADGLARARAAALLGAPEIVIDAIWVEQPAAALVAEVARPYAAGLPGLTEETIDAFARAWLAYVDRIVHAVRRQPSLPSPHWDDVAPGSPEDLARKTAVLTLTTARRWRETFDACPTDTSHAIFYGLTAWVRDGAVLEDALGLPDGPQIRVQPLVDGGPSYLTITIRRSGRRVAVIDDPVIGDAGAAAGWTVVHTPPGAARDDMQSYIVAVLRAILGLPPEETSVDEARLAAMLAQVFPTM